MSPKDDTPPIEDEATSANVPKQTGRHRSVEVSPMFRTEPKRVKWLSLTAYSPLQVVQASNYLRYGPKGVRQFHPGALSEHNPHPNSITPQLILKQVDGDTLLKYDALPLFHVNKGGGFDLEGQNLWQGTRDHLTLNWLWDFQRMTSAIRLEIEEPPAGANPLESWATAYQVIRHLQEGDKILLEVISRSGNILQVYPLDETPTETELEVHPV